MTMNKENNEASNFEIIFNTSPIGMFLLNENSLIDEFNEVASEYLDQEDALGKLIGNGIHCQGSTEHIQGCGFGPQCQACKLRRDLDLVYKTGQATTRLEYCKVLVHNKKKRKFWFRVSLTPIMIKGKRNVVAAFENITDTKLVADSANKYQVLLEKARDIILFIDMKGNILEANQAAIQAYGYTRKELLILKIFDFRERANFTLEQMNQVGEEGILFETHHRRKDGSTFPVEVSSYGTLIEGERVLVSIIRDITEWKQAEKSLLDSERRYRSLFEVAQDGIFLHEIQGEEPHTCKIIDANTMVCQRMGYTKEELLGFSVLDFICNAEMKLHADTKSINYNFRGFVNPANEPLDCLANLFN